MDYRVLIKNRSYQAYIKKIEDLINRKEERIKIGKEAFKTSQKFTSDKVGKEWFTLLEKSDKYE